MRSHHRISFNCWCTVVVVIFVLGVAAAATTAAVIKFNSYNSAELLFTHPFIQSLSVYLSAISKFVYANVRGTCYMIRLSHVPCFQPSQCIVSSKHVYTANKFATLFCVSFTPTIKPLCSIPMYLSLPFYASLVLFRFINFVCTICMYHVIQCDLINVMMTNLFEWIYILPCSFVYSIPLLLFFCILGCYIWVGSVSEC